jgi:hypothetical protein
MSVGPSAADIDQGNSLVSFVPTTEEALQDVIVGQ